MKTLQAADDTVGQPPGGHRVEPMLLPDDDLAHGRNIVRRRAWACLALTLGACATLANTPEQNLAYERWAQCSRPTVTLEWASVDGQITFLYTNPVDRRDVVQCLSDAGRTGPPLPPPVAVGPRGGP